MPATFTGIQNENEFYSHHYLAELFANDIQATTARWREATTESAGRSGTAPDQTLRGLARPYTQVPAGVSAGLGRTRPAFGCNATGSASS